MARQPFFSGNYGSALGQIDTRPIMQGAAAQAAMYQGLGQNIGGAIEKYQLNKVKRAKLTGDIEAYLKENPDYINESTMTGDEAADKKNMTQLEKFAAGDLNMAGLEGLAGKLARGDTLRKNRLLDESQKTLNEANRFSLDLSKKLEKSQLSVAKSEAELKENRATMEKFNLEDFMNLRPEQQLLQLQRLKNELSGEEFKGKIQPRVQSLAEGDLDAEEDAQEVAAIVGFKRGGPEGIAREQIEEMKRKKQALAENLKLVSAQIANIDRETELLGVPDPDKADLRAKYQAEAEKLIAEAAKFRAETQTMGELTGGDAESVPEQASIRPPDVAEAAGGDIPGLFQDVINSAFGVVGAPGFEERHRETANLRALNAQLQPALTKAISSQGSVYTQEKMDKILPQPRDSNIVMQSKLESLVPVLVSKVEEAKIVVQTARAGEQRSRALRVLKTIPGIISALKTSISQKNRRPVNEEADRILEEAGL